MYLSLTKREAVKKQNLHLDCTNCQHMAVSSFCTLKQEELKSLNTYKTTLQVKKKQILFHENDLVRGLHCVHEGKVKLYKTLDDGSTQILRIAKSSDLIGYRGLVGNGRYIATAETIEESVVCFIPKERILELIATNLKFSLGIMAKIAEDISDAENKAISFIQRNSKERLAEALLLMEQSFGVTTDGYIDIILTREELAGITGNVMETAIRILHQWEADGIVTLDKKRIKLNDREALLEISNHID